MFSKYFILIGLFSACFFASASNNLEFFTGLGQSIDYTNLDVPISLGKQFSAFLSSHPERVACAFDKNGLKVVKGSEYIAEKAKLNYLESKSQRNDEEIAGLKNSLNHQMDFINETHQNTLSNLAEQHEIEKKALQEKIDTLTGEAEKSRNYSKRLIQQERQRTDEFMRLSNQKLGLESRLAELSKTHEDLKQDLAISTADYQATLKANAALKASYEESLKTLSDKYEQQLQEHKQQIDELNQSRNTALAETKKLQNENYLLVQQKSEYEAKLLAEREAGKKDRESFDFKLEESNHLLDVKTKLLEEAEKTKEEFGLKADKASAALALAEQAIERYEIEKNEYETRLSEVKSSFETVKDRVKKLGEDNRRLTLEVESERVLLDRTDRAKLELETKAHKTSEALKDAEQTIKKYMIENEKLTSEIAKQLDEIKVYEKKSLVMQGRDALKDMSEEEHERDKSRKPKNERTLIERVSQESDSEGGTEGGDSDFSDHEEDDDQVLFKVENDVLIFDLPKNEAKELYKVVIIGGNEYRLLSQTKNDDSSVDSGEEGDEFINLNGQEEDDQVSEESGLPNSSTKLNKKTVQVVTSNNKPAPKPSSKSNPEEQIESFKNLNPGFFERLKNLPKVARWLFKNPFAVCAGLSTFVGAGLLMRYTDRGQGLWEMLRSSLGRLFGKTDNVNL